MSERVIRGRGRGARRGVYASRPGFSYIMFLGSATLVVLIGLAASGVVRAEMRSSANEGDMARARLNALTALRQGEAMMYTNTDWRDRFSDEAWSDEKSVDEGSFTWKISDADETRKDLTADPGGYARIYGRGVSGDAVWVYSVLMSPPPTQASVEAGRVELVGNGDFTGPTTAGWTATMASLSAKDNTPAVGRSPAGEPSLKTGSRLLLASSTDYVLDEPLVSGQTYTWSFYAVLDSVPEALTAKITIQTSTGTSVIQLANQSVGTSWELLAGQFTPSWTGDFVSATLSFGTGLSLQNFYIDAVTIEPVQSTLIGPVPGSLRRETP